MHTRISHDVRMTYNIRICYTYDVKFHRERNRDVESDGFVYNRCCTWDDIRLSICDILSESTNRTTLSKSTGGGLAFFCSCDFRSCDPSALYADDFRADNYVFDCQNSILSSAMRYLFTFRYRHNVSTPTRCVTRTKNVYETRGVFRAERVRCTRIVLFNSKKNNYNIIINSRLRHKQHYDSIR